MKKSSKTKKDKQLKGPLYLKVAMVPGLDIFPNPASVDLDLGLAVPREVSVEHSLPVEHSVSFEHLTFVNSFNLDLL